MDSALNPTNLFFGLELSTHCNNKGSNRSQHYWSGLQVSSRIAYLGRTESLNEILFVVSFFRVYNPSVNDIDSIIISQYFWDVVVKNTLTLDISWLMISFTERIKSHMM